MATQARNISPLAQIGPPIYVPGFAEGDIVTLSEGDTVTMSSGSITVAETRPAAHTAIGRGIFGLPGAASSLERGQLAEYIEKKIARSMGSLADPYAATAWIDDPFEYRSVPYRKVRTVKAKPRWIGSIPPSPINDD